MLSMLAALGICVGYVCVVVLGVHLVPSVLAALVVCVGYMYVLWRLESTCFSQCLLHLAYVLCFVVLGVHLVLSVLAALVVCVCYMYVLWCLEHTWCCQCLLHLAYVWAICGAWSTPMCWLCLLWGAWRDVVQEGSGPCKIPNFSHLLWSYGTYMYFVRHVRIELRRT